MQNLTIATYNTNTQNLTQNIRRSWLSDINKDAERKKEQAIAQMWLACYAQAEHYERHRTSEACVVTSGGSVSGVFKQIRHGKVSQTLLIKFV